jgi:tetratricopeptide (TPR) repeat protein
MSAAEQAGDRTLSGNLAGSLAYQMSNTGRTAEGLTLARAALAKAGSEAHPKARALYFDRVAWSHTLAGEPQPAMRALGEASEALTAESDSAAPAYLYWVNSGELQVMEARVYTELRRPLRAVPLLQKVLSKYDATHTREIALYLSWLTVALADANEPEEAAATAERMLTLSADLSSERTAERRRIILARLAEFRDVPEAATVLDAHAA